MSEPNYTLVIGDKNLSSWSLRPWLAMKHVRIPFGEERIRLCQPESRPTILCHSPSGNVPTLKADGLVVCDSLAILEFLAERHPGFVTLRNEMSMDLLARLPTPPIGEALESDITRIVAIWRDARARHGGIGPFLFSAFSNADAMFAPVAAR
jgi:glutathione S-transferase